MKHNYFISLILAFTSFSVNGVAQVQTRMITPNEFMSIVGHDKNDETNIISLPSLDIEKVKKEDAEDAKQGLPERFGRAIPLSIGLEAGKWRLDVPHGGYTWRLGVTSKRAKALLINFDDFSLPEGAELYAYNSAKTMVFGPVRHDNSPSKGRFATDLLSGDTIFLELFEPIRARGQSRLHITSVLNAYHAVWQDQVNDTPAPLLPCERDVVCPEGNGVGSEMDAVAFIINTETSGSFSGVLLNNACQNLRPTLLTATHNLLGGANNPSTCSYRFRFRNTSCGGTNTTFYVSIYGATEKFRSPGGNTSTDAVLLELSAKPSPESGITYAGWSRNTNITSVRVLHHPKNNPMKVSTSPAPIPVSNQNIGNRTVTQGWEVAFNLNMTTEAGSSGSGYFDQNGRVIGQHTAGAPTPTCSDIDRRGLAGRFDVYWNEGFSAFLSDDPSVMTTNTIAIPSMSIPADLCANTPLTLSNLPANMGFTGGSIVGATVTGGFSGIEPQSGYNGQGHLEFQFKPNGITCNDPLIVRNNFWVGLPAPQVSFTPGVECYGWLSVDNPQPSHTYNWTISRGANTYYINGPTTYVQNLGPNYASVYYQLVVTNGCGTVTVTGNETLTNCDGPFFDGPNSSSLAMAAKNKTYNWTMQLSPNPVSNDLNIALSAYDERLMHTMGEMHVVNMMGQTVYKAQQVLDNNMRLNTQNLNNGFYILEIKGEGFSTRQRFNVSR